MQAVETIVRVPGVAGGYPAITGTRTSVRVIVELYLDLYPGDIDAIVESLPHLTREQVEAALDFYDANRAIVDEDINRNRHAYFDHLRAK